MNKKGFTLVELLAVITILAIIALITVPIVSGLIKDAKESVNIRTIEEHLSNVSLAITERMISTGKVSKYDVTNGPLSSDIVLPASDKIVCLAYTIKSGKVTEANYCKDRSWNKVYSYTSGKVVSLVFNGTYVAKEEGETHLGIVYLDPSDISRECDSNSTITTTNTGCKKFFIYGVDGGFYKLLMDRNLGNAVTGITKNDFTSAGGSASAWDNEVGNNTKGPITAINTLASRTVGWVGNPRLITADEVAHIVGADREDTIKWSSSKEYGSIIDTQSSWFHFDGARNSNPTSYSGSNGWQKACTTSGCSDYIWLYDYTNGCLTYGCNNNQSGASGYWTSTYSSTYNLTWLVNRKGALLETAQISGGITSSAYGVRPVIKLPIPLVTPFKGTYVAKESGDTHKGIVYLDPSNISNTCNSSSTITDTNKGCKKFYIFDDTGSNYKLLMDRNTTALVAWASHDDYIASGGTESNWTAGKYNTQGPVTVTKQLKIDTANWIGSSRLISESEIRTITGNNTTGIYYFGSNSSTTYANQTEIEQAIQRSYHWLFDYTNGCTTNGGCKTANSSTFGYWTSDAVSDNVGSAWRMNRGGYLSYSNAKDVSYYGVRPVLEVSKAFIEG